MSVLPKLSDWAFIGRMHTSFQLVPADVRQPFSFRSIIDDRSVPVKLRLLILALDIGHDVKAMETHLAEVERMWRLLDPLDLAKERPVPTTPQQNIDFHGRQIQEIVQMRSYLNYVNKQLLPIAIHNHPAALTFLKSFGRTLAEECQTAQAFDDDWLAHQRPMFPRPAMSESEQGLVKAERMARTAFIQYSSRTGNSQAIGFTPNEIRALVQMYDANDHNLDLNNSARMFYDWDAVNGMIHRFWEADSDINISQLLAAQVRGAKSSDGQESAHPVDFVHYVMTAFETFNMNCVRNFPLKNDNEHHAMDILQQIRERNYTVDLILDDPEIYNLMKWRQMGVLIMIRQERCLAHLRHNLWLYSRPYSIDGRVWEPSRPAIWR